jgi:hypothetical protein
LKTLGIVTVPLVSAPDALDEVDDVPKPEKPALPAHAVSDTKHITLCFFTPTPMKVDTSRGKNDRVFLRLRWRDNRRHEQFERGALSFAFSGQCITRIFGEPYEDELVELDDLRSFAMRSARARSSQRRVAWYAANPRYNFMSGTRWVVRSERPAQRLEP